MHQALDTLRDNQIGWFKTHFISYLCFCVLCVYIYIYQWNPLETGDFTRRARRAACHIKSLIVMLTATIRSITQCPMPWLSSPAHYHLTYTRIWKYRFNWIFLSISVSFIRKQERKKQKGTSIVFFFRQESVAFQSRLQYHPWPWLQLPLTTPEYYTSWINHLHEKQSARINKQQIF